MAAYVSFRFFARAEMALILWVLLCGTCFSRISISKDTNNFVDEFNRTIVYHGINIAVADEPFLPQITDSFDPVYSLADQDLTQIVNWGFKFIRLQVLWEMVEPVKGQYNATYVEELLALVKRAESFGLQVVLNAHQDLLCRRFCGVGFPNWAFTRKNFPRPFLSELEMAWDEKGNAEKPYCEMRTMSKMYYTEDVMRSFKEFFNNENGVLDAFREMWKYVAQAMKGQKNIIGYELINDFYEGATYEHARMYLEHLEHGDHINETRLEHLYHFTAEKFREVDQESILFFLPSMEHSHKGMIVTGPGGEHYQNRSAMTYSLYCQHLDKEHALTDQMECKGINQVLFNAEVNRNKGKYGNAILCGEMGAMSETHEEHETELRFMINNVEKDFHWWAFWQYKRFGSVRDPKRHTHTDSMYNENGEPDADKVKWLAHPYAYAICGTPKRENMDHTTNTYFIEFSYGDCKNRRTEIYVNEDLYGENGFGFSYMNCEKCKSTRLRKNYFEIHHQVRPEKGSTVRITAQPHNKYLHAPHVDL